MGGGGNFSGPVPEASYPNFYVSAAQALLHGTGDGDTSTAYNVNITKGVLQVLSDALTVPNVWSGMSAVDPLPHTNQVSSKLTALSTAITALDSENDWETFFDTVKAKMDDLFMDAASVDAAVQAFDVAMGPVRSQRINEVFGALYSANAAEGSCLVNALAILRRGFSAETAAKRTELESVVAAQKAQATLNGIGQIEQADQFSVESRRLLAGLTHEYAVMVINALREQNLDEGTYRTNEGGFYLNYFPQPGNALASFSGGTSVPVGPSKLSSALSGALGGAAQGVSLGSKAGVPGAIAGGIVGALLGGAAGGA